MRRFSKLAFVALLVSIVACDGNNQGDDASPDSGQDGSQPTHAFDVLVDDMDRHYSYFVHNEIDWEALTGRYRADAVETTTAAGFADVVQPMLAELGDLHVWISMPDGEVRPTAVLDAPLIDYAPLASTMSSIQQIGQVAFTARTADGYGFAAIGSLQLTDAEADEIEAALEDLFDTPGIVIDLRNNAGGDELLARRFASMFTEESRVYAYSQIRNGPGHDDFGEPQARTLEPRAAGPRYLAPVVIVTGPRVMSSAEAFVLMFRTLPTVTVIGQPTQGASGNPAPLALENGVTVYYSRWKALDENRQPFEHIGLEPDVPIAADADILATAASYL
jgi:hypothetical protein